jgi:hypothetical protein
MVEKKSGGFLFPPAKEYLGSAMKQHNYTIFAVESQGPFFLQKGAYYGKKSIKTEI